ELTCHVWSPSLLSHCRSGDQSALHRLFLTRSCTPRVGTTAVTRREIADHAVKHGAECSKFAGAEATNRPLVLLDDARQDAAKRCLAGASEMKADAAPVINVVAPLDERVFGHAVERAGQRGAVDSGEVGKLVHGASGTLMQHGENAPLRHGKGERLQLSRQLPIAPSKDLGEEKENVVVEPEIRQRWLRLFRPRRAP